MYCHEYAKCRHMTSNPSSSMVLHAQKQPLPMRMNEAHNIIEAVNIGINLNRIRPKLEEI